MQYYAITKYNRTKSDPFAVARLDDGIIEVFVKGKWTITSAYDGIIDGNFSDYELLTKLEADKLISLT